MSGAAVRNRAGLFGAYAAGFLNDVFGVAACLCPLLFGALGAAYVSTSYSLHGSRWTGLFLLTICLLVLAAAFDATLGDLRGGGMVGNALYRIAGTYLSPGGSALLWIFVGLVGLQLTANFSWFELAGRVRTWLGDHMHARKAEQTAALPSSRAGGAWRPRWLRLPGPEFLKRLREILAPARPAAISMPDVRLEKIGPRTAPALPPRAQQPAEADDVFALALDAEGQSISPESPPPAAPVLEEGDAVAPARGAAAPEDAADDIANPPQPAPALAASPKRDEARSRPDAKAPIPLPSLDLLKAPKARTTVSRGGLEAMGRALMECLATFKIQGELVGITPGPVVTVFEVRPAKGTRVSHIANLSDDLALALKAVSVRIQAPIPGTDTVGIEIPNEHREVVNFRELAGSEEFRQGCGPLTMILGKDIAGRPCLADLSRMPHLLMAGATGAGKSVGLNALLVSLLYRVQPTDLRLLLVDPKRVELAVYADLPHLVHPVVTEMSDAKNALDWAVREMERRYENIARLHVRNITGFNQKLAEYRKDLPDDLSDLEPMPYIVIVIDELADLIMTAGRDAEASIVRLAQLARAAGIHMIVATQRPSTDVVTGLIKANFPCRISFSVQGATNSRIILDQLGAEKLLGRGDMLFKPGGGSLKRVQAPFLSDDEVQAVVDHWKRHMRPSYTVDFSQPEPEAALPGSRAGGSDGSRDPLYPEVVAFASSRNRTSISLIQRQFQIGYNRAARMAEQLQRDGVIGPDGSKPPAK